MTGNVKIGVALVGGYLLGRTKKAKMAIGFGMFLAGKKLSFDPKRLGKLVANSPVLGTLNDQVRKELVDATKTAATDALTQRASGLADSLHRRTLELDDPDGREGLDGRDDGREGPDGKDARAEEREDDDREYDERDDAERDEKPAPRRKPTARVTSGARSAASGATRKKTASGARKTASGARKTASSAARKERGGGNG